MPESKPSPLLDRMRKAQSKPKAAPVAKPVPPPEPNQEQPAPPVCVKPIHKYSKKHREVTVDMGWDFGGSRPGRLPVGTVKHSVMGDDDYWHGTMTVPGIDKIFEAKGKSEVGCFRALHRVFMRWRESMGLLKKVERIATQPKAE